MVPRLSLALAAVAVLVTCGGGSDAPPLQDLSAGEVMARAAAELQKLRSFHFRLDHENGTTAIVLNLSLVAAEGDVAVPDRLQAEIEARAGRTAVRVRAIAVGDRTWITNPFTRQWQRLPGTVSLRDVADPSGVVVAVAGGLKDAKVVGRETVEGAAAYRIAGSVDSAILAAAFGDVDAGIAVRVETWVGAADFLPRRVRLEGPVTRDEPKDIVRVLTLSKFNQAVDIKPPE